MIQSSSASNSSFAKIGLIHLLGNRFNELLPIPCSLFSLGFSRLVGALFGRALRFLPRYIDHCPALGLLHGSLTFLFLFYHWPRFRPLASSDATLRRFKRLSKSSVPASDLPQEATLDCIVPLVVISKYQVTVAALFL